MSWTLIMHRAVEGIGWFSLASIFIALVCISFAERMEPMEAEDWHHG